MILYHGSRNIIRQPIHGFGNPHNDYGLGFYCTENIELAKEWACTDDGSGFANKYELKEDGISCCRLKEPDFHILNWLALLLKNRDFAVSLGLPSEARTYILDTFYPDISMYDVIIGYRADDSYFSFAKAFLNGSISLEQLSQAMKLGRLGEQVVLISEKAFTNIKYVGNEKADGDVYWNKRKARDSAARKQFEKIRNEGSVDHGIYVIDILRKKWKDNDPRLR